MLNWSVSRKYRSSSLLHTAVVVVVVVVILVVVPSKAWSNQKLTGDILSDLNWDQHLISHQFQDIWYENYLIRWFKVIQGQRSQYQSEAQWRLTIPPPVRPTSYLSIFQISGMMISEQDPHSGTLSRISSGTRPSVQTASDVCLKRICSLDTSAFSALQVLDNNRAIQVYLLTYSLTYNGSKSSTIKGHATNWVMCGFPCNFQRV